MDRARDRPPFKVNLIPKVIRQMDRLDPPVRRRIERAILDLAEDPFPDGSRIVQLHTDSGSAYRCRVGDWRVVYTRSDTVRLVTVVQIRHRRDAYRFDF